MEIRPLLLLLLPFVHRPFGAAAISFLPGSCIDAGITTCCDPNEKTCAGLPPICYCDPSCYEFDDCCRDIRVVCPSQQDELLPKEPLLQQTADVTFHSAVIHWGVSPNSSNETYTVHYHLKDSNTTTIIMMDNNDSCAVDREPPEHCMLLTGLDEGTTYFFNVVATNVFGSTQSSTSSFTTMEQGAVEHVRATLVNTTAVKVSWSPLELPRRVSLIRYTIYYTPTQEHSHIDSIENEVILPSNVTVVTIGQLMSQMTYEFQVAATIRDIDRNVSEVPRSLRTAVFVPAAGLIQLRGGPFLHCDTWNAETEEQVLTVFHTATHDTLTIYCACESYISSELLLCDTDAPTYIVYRANIRSSPDHTIAQLIDYMEEWVATSPVVSDGVTLDKGCTVRISLMSAPICQPDVDKPEDVTKSCDQCPCEKTGSPQILQAAQNSTESNDLEDCISVDIFVTSLIAVLLLLLASLMAVIVIILCKTKQSRKASAEIEQPIPSPQQSATVNVYVEQQKPGETVTQTQI